MPRDVFQGSGDFFGASGTSSVSPFGVNVKDYGAIGDGVTRALSSKYGSLAAAQADYPHATSLTDSLEWAAIQKALNTFTSTQGGIVYIPKGHYMIGNKRFSIPRVITIVGEGMGSATIDRAPTDTDATTLDFTGFNLDDWYAGAFSENSTTGVSTLNMQDIFLRGPLEIDVPTDNHAIRLGAASDCSFRRVRISGFSRAFQLSNCNHMLFDQCVLIRQKTAAIHMFEGCGFISIRRSHFANSFYTTAGGVRSGYIVTNTGSANASFLIIENCLFDEQGQNGVYLDQCDHVEVRNSLLYCSNSQSGAVPTRCMRIGPLARDVTVSQCHIEPYWSSGANTDTTNLWIEAGANRTLLDRVTTTTKGTQSNAIPTNAASNDIRDQGTGTIFRDVVRGITSASGQ